MCGKSNTSCRCHQRGWKDIQLLCGFTRQGIIQQLIDDYKFHRVKAAGIVLAELFDRVLDELPEQTIIVPIPTAAANIRRRGYDHMKYIAYQFAKYRNLPCQQLLIRRNNVTQHFTKTAGERKRQAREFFAVHTKSSLDGSYLLIDDIFTTGSTVRAAVDALQAAGAHEVRVAVIAHHTGKL